jgi:hypothetical protein
MRLAVKILSLILSVILLIIFRFFRWNISFIIYLLTEWPIETSQCIYLFFCSNIPLAFPSTLQITNRNANRHQIPDKILSDNVFFCKKSIDDINCCEMMFTCRSNISYLFCNFLWWTCFANHNKFLFEKKSFG